MYLASCPLSGFFFSSRPPHHALFASRTLLDIPLRSLHIRPVKHAGRPQWELASCFDA